MAKIPVGIRLEPEVVERIDETAAAFGTNRSALVTSVVNEAFGTDVDVLEFARMLANRNASAVVGYLNDLEEKSLAAMDELGH